MDAGCQGLSVRVVFVQFGPDISCATMMVDTCKRLGYEVLQLSDMEAPDVPKVDEVWRAPKTGGRMLYRARRLTEVPAPYVMLDTDMLLMRDISDGFDDSDVSLSWRPHHLVKVKHDGIYRMPYNGGLIFVRNADFITDCLAVMEKQTEKMQDWFGDQLALCEVAESGKYKVRALREDFWNHAPNSFAFVDGIRIYHFKGKRKELMPKFYGKLRG